MTPRLPRQLPLKVMLDDSATFENFLVSSANRQALNYLNPKPNGMIEQFTCLWGNKGAGCTHLLQATCHREDALQRSVFYIPLNNHHEFSPEIFEGLESMNLICLDEVDSIAGNAEWEYALFSLFNRLRESGTRLLIATHASPRNLQITLADLLSRLQSGVVFQIQSLDDADKIAALQLRARHRGFEITEEVASYVLQRSDRGMDSLFDLLERLDQHSLETKRRITIPLVRELMGWQVNK